MSDSKFFDKSIQPKCEICVHARPLADTTEVFCLKKGICDADHSCRGYKYDPLKREVRVQGVGKNYSPEDFKL